MPKAAKIALAIADALAVAFCAAPCAPGRRLIAQACVRYVPDGFALTLVDADIAGEVG